MITFLNPKRHSSIYEKATLNIDCITRRSARNPAEIGMNDVEWGDKRWFSGAKTLKGRDSEWGACLIKLQLLVPLVAVMKEGRDIKGKREVGLSVELTWTEKERGIIHIFIGNEMNKPLTNMSQHRGASSSGHDLAVLLHLKDRGLSFEGNNVHQGRWFERWFPSTSNRRAHLWTGDWDTIWYQLTTQPEQLSAKRFIPVYTSWLEPLDI